MILNEPDFCLADVLNIPLYKNFIWLHYLVDVEKKSRRSIAKENGVSDGVVRHWYKNEAEKIALREIDNKRRGINLKINGDKINAHRRKYRSEHREERSKKRLNKKIEIINGLGGKCKVCGETDIDTLEIDHIFNDGAVDRRRYNVKSTMLIIRKLLSKGVSYNELKERYQILCSNHNAEKQYKGYFDLPEEQLTNSQKNQLKLWKEAHDFFGPCKCGQNNLKYLCIDHVKNDGAERRRNGEKMGHYLIRDLRNKGWPESLREDYQLLCFNCNMKKKIELARLNSPRNLFDD